MNKDKAYAIAIDSFRPYKEPIDIIAKYPGVIAPQCFRYIDESDFYVYSFVGCGAISY